MGQDELSAAEEFLREFRKFAGVQVQGMEGSYSLQEVGLAGHHSFLHMNCRLTTELEGDSQDLEEQLLHPLKTRRMEEVQAVISQSQQKDEVV